MLLLVSYWLPWKMQTVETSVLFKTIIHCYILIIWKTLSSLEFFFEFTKIKRNRNCCCPALWVSEERQTEISTSATYGPSLKMISWSTWKLWPASLLFLSFLPVPEFPFFEYSLFEQFPWIPLNIYLYTYASVCVCQLFSLNFFESS